MHLESMSLVWIVVKNLKEAIEFYTETVGLKLVELNDQFGWAELEGQNGGARLGIAQTCPESQEEILPGQNAVMTFNVRSIEQAILEMKSKGAKLVGEMKEIPGHVKMQTVKDLDDNCFQLVEVAKHQHKCTHC